MLADTAATRKDTITDPAMLQLEPMQLACTALLQALEGPDLIGRLQALQLRLDNGLDTDADRQLLADLPACQLSAQELVNLFVRVDEAARMHH